jgi:hypothetical protein
MYPLELNNSKTNEYIIFFISCWSELSHRAISSCLLEIVAFTWVIIYLAKNSINMAGVGNGIRGLAVSPTILDIEMEPRGEQNFKDPEQRWVFHEHK